MLERLLIGLDTRSYGKTVGKMPDTVVVSKSSVGRHAGVGERLKELMQWQHPDAGALGMRIFVLDGSKTLRAADG